VIKHGLASLDERSGDVFEEQAARLVDAQAPGLAARLRQISRIPRAHADWAWRVLAELGLLALTSHAARRLAELAPPLAADVRSALGLSLERDDVVAGGDLVHDAWAVLGQIVDDSERIRMQRTWLRGLGCGRDALVLQFAAGHAPFAEAPLPGTCFSCTLAFWPGAAPLRALLHGPRGEARPLDVPLPGRESIGAFLASFAALLGRQPWLERGPCALCDVVPVAKHDGFFAVGATGEAIPLAAGSHWVLCALAGGLPLDLFGEWDGCRLVPLGCMTGGRFFALAKEPA
jgi:hypothetical protein